MKLTYFVHSTTIDNEKGLATGWLPGELSEQGVKQSLKVHDLLADSTFDMIFTSDLHRAIQSAKLFFDSKIPSFQDSRLRECNYGDFDGTLAKEFKRDREQFYIKKPYPNGESYIDVERRIRVFLQELATSNYKHVAIVAHQAPQLALDVIVHGLTWEVAIKNDWRKSGAWQPGWSYEIQ